VRALERRDDLAEHGAQRVGGHYFDFSRIRHGFSIPSFVPEADRLDELAETLELVPDARRNIMVDLLGSILAGKLSLPYRIGFS
jgi:hypothetical protein